MIKVKNHVNSFIIIDVEQAIFSLIHTKFTS